jgi:hypothetical protein
MRPQFVDTTRRPPPPKDLLPKLRPFADSKQLIVRIDSNANAYMWDRKPREPEDEADKQFLAGKMQTTKLFGFHTFGYPMFFKPDLTEVAKLICEAKLEADVYFVCTEPCNDDGKETDRVIGGCLDESRRLHMGVTYVVCYASSSKLREQPPGGPSHPVTDEN